MMTHKEIQTRYNELKERHKKAETAFEGLGVIKDVRSLQDAIADIGGLPDHLQHIVEGLNNIADSIDTRVE